MKRTKRGHLSTTEREILLAALEAGENVDVLAARFNLTRQTVQGYSGLLKGRVRDGRESARTTREAERHHNIRTTCLRAGCDGDVVDDGRGLCAKHGRMPVLPDGGFVKPPSLKRLMAGR